MNLCLIQARITSNRLPGKCMMKIMGKTLIDWVIEGVINTNQINYYGVIVPKEEESFSILKKYIDKCYTFAGSKYNVLNRYYKAVKHHPNYNEIKNVIRLTGDCPMLGLFPSIIDDTITAHLESKADYTHNRGPNGYCSGLDVEIMKKEVLEELENTVTDIECQEHVTLYIKKYKELFNIKEVNCDYRIRFDKKWSVDTKEDYHMVSDAMKLLKLEG